MNDTEVLRGQISALNTVLTQVILHMDNLTAAQMAVGVAIEAETLRIEEPNPARDAVLQAYLQLLSARAP